MATVTDFLVTILKLEGAPAFAVGMAKAAGAVEKLSNAQKGKGGKGGGLGDGLKEIASQSGLVSGQMNSLLGTVGRFGPAVAITAGAILFGKKALDEFADAQTRAFQTSVVLKNIGSSATVEGLQQLGSEIQKLTGFDDDLVVSLGGTLAKFGVAGDQIPAAVRSIADAAAGTGQSMEEIGDTVGKALLGQTRGLRQLGIEFKSTGNKARDLANIEEQLNQRFGGAGAARRQTLAGAFDALQNATGNFFAAVGRILGPGMIKLLNFFADKLQLLADKIESIADRLHIGRPQDAAAGIGGKGLKGDPQQTKLLGDIADNTSKTADNFVRAVLGGKGEIAKRAGSWRDAGIALGT
jgi:biotin operon repressor